MSRVLIVDDSDVDRLLIAAIVKKKIGVTAMQADCGEAALDIIADDDNREISTVLLDLNMPGMNGMETMAHILKNRQDIQIIVITGMLRDLSIMDILHAGASDFLTKPLDPDALCQVLSKAVSVHRMTIEYRKRAEKQARLQNLGRLLETTPDLKPVIDLARRAALSDITVLITGESGVGKEIVARALHAASMRHLGPFIPVHCGAITPELVESTLFGHRHGAFTGTIGNTIGKFAEAEGGTLFLDEIGSLSHDVQVKLLRVLQDKIVAPLGADTGQPMDVRIIAATNRDMAQDVADNIIRQDLFYKLNGFPIIISPLRARPRDISLLARHFIEQYALAEEKNVQSLTEAAHDWLLRQMWPGNVRELENLIHRAVLMCDSEYLDTAHLDHSLQIATDNDIVMDENEEAILIRGEDATYDIPLRDANGAFRPLHEIRLEIERAALVYCNYDYGAAARHLGIGKSTLYRHQSDLEKDLKD